MSRPTYERSGDLQREAKAIEAMGAVWGVQFAKTPKFYSIDFCMIDQLGKVCGWVEIKGKTFARSTYPTFYTSTEKLLRLIRMGQFTGLPAFLVCSWLDGVFYIQPTPSDCRRWAIKVGGRVDRGDADDVEPVTHIPVEEFKPVASGSPI
jgi:hypothetical protein